MRHAFTLLEILIVVAIVAVIATFLWPVLARPHDPDRRDRSCQSNLKQIGLAFLQYAQDADEKFPPARSTVSTGWADLLQPYVKSQQLFACAMTQKYFPPASDYFYNRALARVKSARIDEPALVTLSGDGDDNRPTWASWSSLPLDASTNPNSPAQRHRDGANYGFSDGHVKWFRPQDLGARASWKPRLF